MWLEWVSLAVRPRSDRIQFQSRLAEALLDANFNSVVVGGPNLTSLRLPLISSRFAEEANCV